MCIRDRKNLEPAPDLVVVGNAISRGNPELEYVLDHRLPMVSMAELIHQEFLNEMCIRDRLSTFMAHVEHATAATTVANVILRLAMAGLFGGIIGIERQLKHRPAGLRTNMFICFGAALFTIVSSLMSGPQEETRIAAQIVTGIGFIGGGVILRAGGTIQAVSYTHLDVYKRQKQERVSFQC